MARAHVDLAHRLLACPRAGRPDMSRWHAGLGMLSAELGHRDEAVRASRRAVELMPLERDRWIRYCRRLSFARVLTRLGEADAAVDELAHLLTVPSYVSVPELRADPTWNSLRGKPRCRRLEKTTP